MRALSALHYGLCAKDSRRQIAREVSWRLHFGGNCQVFGSFRNSPRRLGMALFLFAYGILGADSLSEPHSSPALSWPPLWLVQTHAEKSGPAWGSRAGTAEAEGLLCSP